MQTFLFLTCAKKGIANAVQSRVSTPLISLGWSPAKSPYKFHGYYDGNGAMTSFSALPLIDLR
jgi:hypothetical protein